MKLQFTKMHSLGNDFIIIDNRKAVLKNLFKLSKRLSDRRFGIGADQILFLCRSNKADFKMRILNSDGSEVEMCGNGIRCLGKYIRDRKIRDQRPGIIDQKNISVSKYLSIETLAGVKLLKKIGSLIEVDMGEPIFDPDKIPVLFNKNARTVKRSSLTPGPIINYPLKVNNKIFKITCVSMGNPHAVIHVKDIRSVSLEKYGPLIEHHKLFPKRTNVEFIQVLNKNNLKLRVWERGSGETMACGTGASASAVVSVLLGLSRRKIVVHLPGGKLRIQWSETDNHVYMTGDAVTVFEGVIEI